MISTKKNHGSILKKGLLQNRFLQRIVDARNSCSGINNWIEKNFDEWYINNLVRKVKESKYIDKVVLLAFDGVYNYEGRFDTDRTFFYVPNEIVLNAADSHPELLPGVSINPYRSDAIEELERCVQRGAVLVKWVPNSEDIDPADKRIVPFYKKMVDLDLPLLTHTGYEHTLVVYNQSLGDPRRLCLALDCGVTVIAAHAGCYDMNDPINYFPVFIEMTNKYKNLYGDLAVFGWPSRKKILLDIISDKAYLFDRMLHGTDYPVPVMPIMMGNESGWLRMLRFHFKHNYFDAEALMKLYLGVPKTVFTRASSLLRL